MFTRHVNSWCMIRHAGDVCVGRYMLLCCFLYFLAVCSIWYLSGVFYLISQWCVLSDISVLVSGVMSNAYRGAIRTSWCVLCLVCVMSHTSLYSPPATYVYVLVLCRVLVCACMGHGKLPVLCAVLVMCCACQSPAKEIWISWSTFKRFELVGAHLRDLN